MAKNPTLWVDTSGTSDVTDDNANVQRIEEDGLTIRTLEDGTVRVFEDAVIIPKPATAWAEV